MRILKLFTFFFFILSGSVHAHPVSCISLLAGVSENLMSARWRSLPSEEQRNLLLMMLGSNSQLAVSRKDIFEKGEMNLGLPVGDGRTLILSFQADSRLELKYKLVQMKLLDQAANQEKLDNHPLDNVTLELTPKAWKALEEVFGEERIRLPTFFSP